MNARLIRSTAVQHKLGDVLAKNLAAVNLLGRAQVAKMVYRKTGKVIPISTGSRLGLRRHVHFDEAEESANLHLGFSLDLPATNAADHLRDLTPVTKSTFDGLSDQYKRDAFTVAGASDVRLIEKIRDALADVIKKGGTEKDFDAAAAKLTSAAGVEKINAFTLDTVFSINMHKAYSLGRLEQLTDPDVLTAIPFWGYMTVEDDRVRPEHADLDKFAARATDPVWRKIYPPSGFGCRCIVIGLLAEEAPENANEDGLARLPMLVRAKVPQPGFTSVFSEYSDLWKHLIAA